MKVKGALPLTVLLLILIPVPLFSQEPVYTPVVPPAEIRLDNVKPYTLETGVIRVTPSNQGDDVKINDVKIDDVKGHDIKLDDAVKIKDVKIDDVKMDGI